MVQFEDYVMLIKAPVAPGAVVSFRIVSGEEIVGKLVSDDGERFVISKPIVIALRMMPNGEASVAFMPFMASIDDSGNMTFKHSHVINPLALTRDDVSGSYIHATTGIEPVKKSGLLGV